MENAIVSTDRPPTVISQRDLRNWSAGIMDGLERGEEFTITRNGRPVGLLVPLDAPRREVPTGEAMAAFEGLASGDYAKMREQIDQAFGDEGDRIA